MNGALADHQIGRRPTRSLLRPSTVAHSQLAGYAISSTMANQAHLPTSVSSLLTAPSLPLGARGTYSRLSVSNSLSGRDWELDEVPAVGDPAHVAQIGKGLRLSTDERRRRVSLQ